MRYSISSKIASSIRDTLVDMNCNIHPLTSVDIQSCARVADTLRVGELAPGRPTSPLSPPTLTPQARPLDASLCSAIEDPLPFGLQYGAKIVHVPFTSNSLAKSDAAREIYVSSLFSSLLLMMYAEEVNT
jgi:hypothetical protein